MKEFNLSKGTIYVPLKEDEEVVNGAVYQVVDGTAELLDGEPTGTLLGVCEGGDHIIEGAIMLDIDPTSVFEEEYEGTAPNAGDLVDGCKLVVTVNEAKGTFTYLLRTTGGSSPESQIVNVHFAYTDDGWTADKTFEEVKTAIEAGKLVYGSKGDELNAVDSIASYTNTDSITFTFLSPTIPGFMYYTKDYGISQNIVDNSPVFRMTLSYSAEDPEMLVSDKTVAEAFSAFQSGKVVQVVIGDENSATILNISSIGTDIIQACSEIAVSGPGEDGGRVEKTNYTIEDTGAETMVSSYAVTMLGGHKAGNGLSEYFNESDGFSYMRNTLAE